MATVSHQLSWARTFPAMGTTATVRVVGGGPGLLDDAQRRIAALEGRWSRFLPGSDVGRLNERAGAWVTVAAETLDLLALAVSAEAATGGRFSVLVEPAMVANGYGRSFERGPTPTRPPVPRRGAVEFHPAGGRARLVDGARVDLGGIAKGRTADVVTAELLASGAAGALVDLGGDVRVRGEAPGRQGWLVEVEHPQRPGMVVAAVALADGAVATSSTQRRRWRAASGTVAHHVVDPATGAPTDSGLVGVSCVAASAADAEVLTKAVLVGGPAEGRALLARWGLEAVLVDGAGRVERIGAWEQAA